MSSYTNQFNIPLSVCVWLATDHYDHDARNNHISVTALLKSDRQIVLATRIPPKDSIPDVSGLVASRMGTAIHDHIEIAWTQNYKSALKNLGYPQRVIDRIRVNPEKDELGPDVIPVYLERRSEKEIDGYIISGKFDFVGEGRVEDFKSTGVYSYINKTKDEDYIMQGSIYRWLNQDIITQDTMAIQFIFTNWNAMEAARGRDNGYPQNKTMEYKLQLKSIAETEAWIKAKLHSIKTYLTAADENIPLCNEKQLWRKETVFKYYKNPAKMTKSTKNFKEVAEARIRLITDGNVGVVVEKPGEVVACKYCDAYDICQQKDTLIANGELKI